MSGQAPQKFGLIIRQPPNAKSNTNNQHTASAQRFGMGANQAPSAKPPPARKSFFDEDDELDEADDDKAPASEKARGNLELQREAQRRQEKAAREQAAILAEDATVYAYDEVYEDLSKEKQQRDPLAARRTEDKAKSKYIDQLQRKAEERKREQNRLFERQARKELEKEGSEFKDKDQFVTSAYKAQLIQMRKDEEEEKKREAYEAKHSVSQSGMAGFYRNMLNRDNVALGGTNEGPKPHELVQPKEETPASSKPSPLPSAPVASSATAPPAAASSIPQAPPKVDDDDQTTSELVQAQPVTKKREPVEETEEEKAAKLARRNTEDSVISAKERYLQRKRAQQQQQLEPANL